MGGSRYALVLVVQLSRPDTAFEVANVRCLVDKNRLFFIGYSAKNAKTPSAGDFELRHDWICGLVPEPVRSMLINRLLIVLRFQLDVTTPSFDDGKAIDLVNGASIGSGNGDYSPRNQDSCSARAALFINRRVGHGGALKNE